MGQWLKINKGWAVLGGIVLITSVASAFAGSPTATTPPIAPTYTVKNVQQVPASNAQQTQTSAGLSNNNYYENVSGNTVHSPAYTDDNAVPSGASAKCGDGTYSFSQHRSGTCSHHG